MTDIAVVVAQVMVLHPDEAEIYSAICASAVTKGQALYLNSSGKVAPADANDSGLQQVVGIALKAGAADETISMLIRGYCAGYTLTNQSFDDGIYLSDTGSGVIADSNGTLTVPIGRIGAITELGSLTKMIKFDIRYGADWA